MQLRHKFCSLRCTCGKLDFNRICNGFLCGNVKGLYDPQKPSHQHRRRGQSLVSSCLEQCKESLRASYGEIVSLYQKAKKISATFLFTWSIKVNRERN